MAAFTNQATLSYNNLVTTSNIVQGELVETLTAAKTPIESNYQSDEVVTYAISLVNAGTTAFRGHAVIIISAPFSAAEAWILATWLRASSRHSSAT